MGMCRQHMPHHLQASRQSIRWNSVHRTFRQAGPVVSGAGETATLAASVKSSLLWKHINVYTLSIPIRSLGDPQFTRFVDQIGEDCSQHRQPLQLLAKTTNIDDAAEFLFPQNVLANANVCLNHAFLSPRNMFVDEFNEKILAKLPSDYSK